MYVNRRLQAVDHFPRHGSDIRDATILLVLVKLKSSLGLIQWWTSTRGISIIEQVRLAENIGRLYACPYHHSLRHIAPTY